MTQTAPRILVNCGQNTFHFTPTREASIDFNFVTWQERGARVVDDGHCVLFDFSEDGSGTRGYIDNLLKRGYVKLVHVQSVIGVPRRSFIAIDAEKVLVRGDPNQTGIISKAWLDEIFPNVKIASTTSPAPVTPPAAPNAQGSQGTTPPNPDGEGNKDNAQTTGSKAGSLSGLQQHKMKQQQNQNRK